MGKLDGLMDKLDGLIIRTIVLYNDEMRTILHVDMNAYFTSVEQAGNPLLRNKPLIVVGDLKRRCIVLTASYEARPYGIHTGMILHDAVKLCPKIQIVQGNSKKYMHASIHIHAILQTFSDLVEMSSCDEAYLDLTRCLKYWKTDGEGVARLIQSRIQKDLKLPCSVGVAPNKMLAKLASEKKKPMGITVISPDNADQVLSETPIEELCGIGGKMKTALNRLGIQTCRQLGEADESFLRHHFHFWGHWLKRMGQGADESPVRATGHFVPEKSIGHSTTLPANTGDMDIIEGFLLLLSEKVAVRMREAKVLGSTITLHLRYDGFIHFGQQRKRRQPTDDGYEIFKTVSPILEAQEPFPALVRQIGVRVSDLVPDERQYFLFEAMNKKRGANAVKDEIDKKYGRHTLKPASFLFAENFGVLESPLPPFIKI